MEEFPFRDTEFVGSWLNICQSEAATVKTCMDLIESARPSTKGAFLDLGCGEGRFVIEAAKRGYLAVGIELDVECVSTARKKARDAGVTCIFLNGDFANLDLDAFQVITCYLYQPMLVSLGPRLSSRLAKGDCVIATMLYKIPALLPFKTEDLYKIYLYE